MARSHLVWCLVAAAAVLCTLGSWASAGTAPTLSREQVRQIALDWNAQQERATGRVLSDVRVARIARTGASWRVTYAGGTYVGCGGWWCSLCNGNGGGITISDRPVSCSGNREACERLSKILLNRVTGTRSGKRSLGNIPLYQAMQSRSASSSPRSAADARRIALRYLADNEAALGSSMPSSAPARVVSLRRLSPGQVHMVDARQGGFKAGPPTWIARVGGTLANCIEDYPGSKGYDSGTPTAYGTRQCTLASSGYLGIADNRSYPTAVILTGHRTTIPLSAIASRCKLTRFERILC